MQVPINFVGSSYSFENKPLSAQRTVNYYLEVSGAEGRTPIALRGCPGLKSFVTGLDGAVDSLYFFDGVLYASAGTKLYSIDSLGVATERGDIGSGRKAMSWNGTQIVIVNGATGYVYTPSTSTLSQITDTDFKPASSVVFMDQYSVFEEAGTGRFFISALTDSSTFDGTDFATAESAPDDTLAVLSDHRQLILLGTSTIEFWYNSSSTSIATADFPFVRQQGAIIERGLAAKYAIAKGDDTFFWLGDNLRVYRANGFASIPISTPAIEEQFQKYTVDDAFAFFYTWKGHNFFCLVFPTDGKVWECDVNLPPNLAWHERTSYDQLADKNEKRWMANCHTKNENNLGCRAYNKNLVGDYQMGTIWEMDDDTFDEGGEPLVVKRTTHYSHADQRTVFMSELEVLMESGVGLLSGQGSDPQAIIRTSKDGGRTFGNERRFAIGATGDYRRIYGRNFGGFKSKAFQIEISDPVNRDILGATGEITVGL